MLKYISLSRNYINVTNRISIAPQSTASIRSTRMSAQDKRSRVLSIQSHVVAGYVGNKSATFPLQVLGFEVDPINSVQFSNHTGYGYWKGQVLNDDQLGDLIDGLTHNKLDRYTHLLTGYVGSASFLTKIAGVVKHLRSLNPELVYVCDPVMGDNGAMYVPLELLAIYRDTIVPLADIITPNQYEVELLTSREIKSLDDAWSAVRQFHDQGVKTVVLSSTELGSGSNLLGLASTMEDGKHNAWTISIPKLPHSFTGTGDLFAALFLAWTSRLDGDVCEALERTVATIQAVLVRTETAHCGDEDIMELRLIQSKADIEAPVVIVRASKHHF